jgi:hypothetical protein
MERGSVQHGARVDDELAEGVEGLVTGAPVSAREREEYDPEAPAAAEIDLGVESAHEAVIERSELARWLLPSTFPGDREALVAGAVAEQAPDDVVARLRTLDPGTRFLTVGDVWVALGHPMETRDAPQPVEIIESAPEIEIEIEAEDVGREATARVAAVIEAQRALDVAAELEVASDLDAGEVGAEPIDAAALAQPHSVPPPFRPAPAPEPSHAVVSTARKLAWLPFAVVRGALRGAVDGALGVLLDRPGDEEPGRAW